MLTDNTIVKIGKIMKKPGFKGIKRANIYSYILRILDVEVVEKGIHSLDELDAQAAKQEANNQIIMLEEDMAYSCVDPNLPF